MKQIIMGLLLLISNTALCQVTVFDCYGNTTVTQTEIMNEGAVIYRNCVDFPNTQTFLFTGDTDKEIRATKQIKIEPGFRAGAFSSVGKMKLTVQEKSDFDVVSISNSDLSTIPQFEKFELGMTLPTALQTKVTNFLLNNSVPATEKVNPFLEWNLRVVAEFKSAAQVYTYPVDGFYFRNFQRDETHDSWSDDGTAYPFRIRFAPLFLGNWTCVIKVYVNDVLTYSCPTFSFNVISSSNPGFVKVHSNGKNLARGTDANLIYPVATNLPFPGGFEAGGVDYQGGPTYLQNYKMHYLKDYLTNIQAYADQGGKYFRYIVNQPTSEIEFEKLGNYYDRLMFASEIDKMLDLAHNEDMLVFFTLMLHTTIMKEGDYNHDNWDFGSNGGTNSTTAYCYSTAFGTEIPSDMILNTTAKVDNHIAMDYMKQRYRYYIARYGYSTNVELFELLSEPFHMNEEDGTPGHPYRPAETSFATDGNIARQAITTFHTQLADYIKEHLAHDQHLIASQGHMPIYTAYALEPDAGSFTVNETSWSNSNIDVATTSTYGCTPAFLINNKTNDNFGNDNIGFTSDEKTMAYSVHNIYNAYGKPTIIAETGEGADANGNGFSDCSNNLMHEFNARRLGFLGLAGFNMWSGWVYGDPTTIWVDNHTTYWPATLHVQDHMNGADVRNVLGSNWTQGRELQQANGEDGVREQEYYVSNDKTSCVGYVANRTYNPYTLNTVSGSACATLDVGATCDVFLNIVSCTGPVGACSKLEVQGLLANTDYTIDWYHYGDGGYAGSDCFNTTSNGVWRMDHPVLELSTPIFYYVIKKQSCSSGLAINNQGGGIAQSDALNSSLDRVSDDISGTWHISPNPSSDVIQVSGSDPIDYLRLTDNKGIVVKEFKGDGMLSYSLDIKELNSGVYFISINGLSAVQRVVKL